MGLLVDVFTKVTGVLIHQVEGKVNSTLPGQASIAFEKRSRNRKEKKALIFME